MKIIEKITLKPQASGSNGHNDSNFNEYDTKDYEGGLPHHISFYIVFLSFC